MKVTIHAEGTTAEIAKQLSVAAAVYAGTKGPKTKATKTEPEEEEDEAEFSDTEEEEETDADDSEEDSEDADDSDDEEDGLDLKTVIAGFKTYAKKHSRDKAALILKKFKVKSVQDLKKTQFAEVLKALKK